MLAICSFLQSVYQLVRTLTVKSVNVTKQMYRSRAILMTGSVVVAVLTFASAGFAGGGRNALTAYAETSSEEESLKETEEIEEKIKRLKSPMDSLQMTLSFMGLLAIPSLKLSNKGLFNSETFQFTSLFV